MYMVDVVEAVRELAEENERLRSRLESGSVSDDEARRRVRSFIESRRGSGREFVDAIDVIEETGLPPEQVSRCLTELVGSRVIEPER